MMCVVAELVYHGVESQKRVIGEMVIWNNKKSTLDEELYNASLTCDGQFGQIVDSTENVKHTRKESVFNLIFKVLKHFIA